MIVNKEDFYQNNLFNIKDNKLISYNCKDNLNAYITIPSNITSIDDAFLYGIRLENIDLTFLSKVTIIGNYFLANCIELKNINLTPLSNVISIGYYFLYECSRLENITLKTKLKLTSVGDNFLFRCKSLKFINRIPIPEGESLNKYIFELVESV